MFYEVKVLDALRGNVADAIVVSGPDADAFASTNRTPLRVGERVVLSLVEQTTADAPGIEALDFFYVPVSLDNGVFDVSADNSIIPCMPEAFRVYSVLARSFTLQETRALPLPSDRLVGICWICAVALIRVGLTGGHPWDRCGGTRMTGSSGAVLVGVVLKGRFRLKVQFTARRYEILQIGRRGSL